MTKIYQNAEIIKMSYASALNTQSQEITRKKIQLVNMQHLYFDSNLVRFQYISDEAEKLEKEIKELEIELVINWAKALTICKGKKEEMMNKYIDALEYIENEEVLYEDIYNEDDVSFSKEILCEVEYLKEHFDALHELIYKYSKLEKALDKACEELEYFDSTTATRMRKTNEQWKEWLLDNDY